MNKNHLAGWDVVLMCDCPHCDKYVNLLDYVDFWDGRQLDVCEHDTERSRDLEVVCPECGDEFVVDLCY